ncbi:MAG: type III secretion system chaperone [Planctomycetaceae bacterium]|nr:type III secretion system chaperone [Planctomycetaceae bacterium]
MTNVWARSTGATCCGILLVLAMGVGLATSAEAADSAAPARRLTNEDLGTLLRGLGLQPVQEESRFDFQFKAMHKEEEWELSMSAVISQNGKSVWVMAWLDELPKSRADVSQLALLRLLSENDRLGNGKFFAYIASNRRFVMQRVVANENLTAQEFRTILEDLGFSVAQTYPAWNTENWKSPGASSNDSSSSSATNTRSPANPQRRAINSAVNDSKFQPNRQN